MDSLEVAFKKLPQRPEVLAPAGSLSKLKVAVHYGADAVYLGGQKFGLRAASENFTNSELQEGVKYAHARKSKVYVVLNSFFHRQDFEGLDEFLTFLSDIKVDAVIVSDLGVVDFISQNYKSLVIHLSTQASCLNVSSALFWKERGVKRIVLGREVTLNEAKIIKEKTKLEIEMFIHGSMCMSYSGHCVISNYTQGRDSNRGGCAHSCRFEYKLKNNGQEISTYFMSSKDLEGVDVIPHFFDAGIDSVKIEGRMKGPLYAATTTKIYREALECYQQNPTEFVKLKKEKGWTEELNKFSHRDYTNGSLIGPADMSSIYNKRESEEKTFDAIGTVLEIKEGQYLLIEVRNKFSCGETLEILPFRGKSEKIYLDKILSASGSEIESTKPGSVVRIPYVKCASPHVILRREVLQ